MAYVASNMDLQAVKVRTGKPRVKISSTQRRAAPKRSVQRGTSSSGYKSKSISSREFRIKSCDAESLIRHSISPSENSNPYKSSPSPFPSKQKEKEHDSTLIDQIKQIDHSEHHCIHKRGNKPQNSGSKDAQTRNLTAQLQALNNEEQVKQLYQTTPATGH